MSCAPYNSIRGTDSSRHVFVGGNALGSRFILAMLVCLLVTRAAQAQWWCAPVETCPQPICVPVDGFTQGYVVVQRPVAPIDSTSTGPLLSPLVVPSPQSYRTNFQPPDELSPSPITTPSQLSAIAGELRIVLTESLLNRLLTRTDTNAGPIQDVILGANVSGEQTTQSRISVDVQPSQQTARLSLNLAGTTINQSIGVTPQAVVRSRGAHKFRMTKQVDFDGLRFTTRTPAAWVTPRMTNEGAVTPMSGMPLIGPLATRIALSEAERRRPIAEQILSQRLTEQVAPRFNQEVDQLLGQANDRLRSSVPALQRVVDLVSSNEMFSSTDDQVQFGLRLPDIDAHSTLRPPRQSPASAMPLSLTTTERNAGWVPIRQITQRVSVESRSFIPPPEVTAGTSLTIAVHERFVNHLLRCAPLEGLEVPDRTIDRMLTLLSDVLSGNPIGDAWSGRFDVDETEFATLLFAESGPLSMRFENGQAVLIAHSGFRPRLTPEVPTQRIRIPFTLSATEGHFALEPGDVTVDSLSGEPDAPLVKLARPVIRQQVENRLQTVTLPRSVPVHLPGLPQTSLTIRSMTLADGWLVMAVD